MYSGRVARAGRSGTAYSLIAPDEIAYVIDLHLFLGRPLKIAQDEKMSAGMSDELFLLNNILDAWFNDVQPKSDTSFSNLLIEWPTGNLESSKQRNKAKGFELTDVN